MEPIGDDEEVVLEFDSNINISEIVKDETEIEVIKEDTANNIVYLKINNFYFKGEILNEEFSSLVEEIDSLDSQVKFEIQKEKLKSRKKILVKELVQL
jgi:hypothetical protein